MSLAAETKLGPYGVVAPLCGRDGRIVPRTRDTRLGRDVAVKKAKAAIRISSHPEQSTRELSLRPDGTAIEGGSK
jgi:hypothetical protein